MRTVIVRVVMACAALAGCLQLAAAIVLPPLLLSAWTPRRSEGERAAVLDALRPPEATWTEVNIPSGGGATLRAHWLHRPASKGVVILLHGFGDDGYGSAPRLHDFPDWDALVFTFRGRDDHPEVPCTLGAWERTDVAAAVRHLGQHGVHPRRIVLVAASMGAGVALLALHDLERHGVTLGGALLESPFEDLPAATRDHLRGTIGAAEWLLRPGELLAIARAGQLARFDPARVSPVRASRGLRTPIAIVAGDADEVTPIEGVRAIAVERYPLTVVHGAGHMEASAGIEGGYRAWAGRWLRDWGF